MRILATLLLLSLLCTPALGASMVDGYPVGVIVVDVTGSVERTTLSEWEPRANKSGYAWSTTLNPQGLHMLILVRVVDPNTGFERRIALGSETDRFDLEIAEYADPPKPITLRMELTEDGGLLLGTLTDSGTRIIRSGDTICLGSLEYIRVTYYGVVPDSQILRHEYVP